MQVQKIVIADKNEYSRNLLIQAIENEPFLSVVGDTGDGGQLLSLCRKTHCDIVVMELLLPTMDGLEVIDSLHMHGSCPRILLLSEPVTDADLQQKIDQYADYHMDKPCKVIYIIQRLRQIAQSLQAGISASQPFWALEAPITAALKELCIPSHIIGYHYLRDSIAIALEDPGALRGITKVLYPDIAKAHNSTAIRVERSMRHAITVCWDHCPPEILRQYFGYGISGGLERPTNRAFITQVAAKVRLRLKNGVPRSY